jgi:hypothetical protein
MVSLLPSGLTLILCWREGRKVCQSAVYWITLAPYFDPMYYVQKYRVFFLKNPKKLVLTVSIPVDQQLAIHKKSYFLTKIFYSLFVEKKNCLNISRP